MRMHKGLYDCCGCTACENICPKHAITMQPDLLGFLYPRIDDKKCIDCGLCEKICSFSINYKQKCHCENQIVFAVRSRKKENLLKSQSGAAFFEFAKSFIKLGGIVYGASLDTDFVVKHIRVDTIAGLERLRLSKYTQSQLETIFQQVKKDLQNGIKVLFSGTPCQIAGLNSFISEKLRSLLTTIDVICHGVPSPSVWQEYIKYIGNKYGKIRCCIFRDKKFGWASHFESFIFCNGKTMSTRIFRDLFYNHLILRYSCYKCPFTNLERVGDITIGDFWGWSNISTEFNDNLGVSLVFINTERGQFLFNSTKPHILYIKSNVINCLQPQLQYPAPKHPKREQFEIDFNQRGFQYVAKQYGVIGFQYHLRRLLKNFVTLCDKVKWHIKIHY